MKKKALGFVALAMTLLANTATMAYNGVGDIVSIDPCNEYGIKQPVNTAVKSAGETAYFRIRLLNVNCRMSYDTRNAARRTNPWLPDYNGMTVGSGVMEQMWLANPPKIGVYVSGQLRGATVGYPYAVTMDDDGSWAGWYTDLVCSYTVKPGDLALPMTLANASGSEVGGGSGATYFFNTIPASSVWRLRADERAGSDTDENWSTVVATNYCQFAFNSGSTDLPAIYTPDWTTDYNLKQAGLYLQSVDFAATAYSVPGRRTAEGEGSTRNATVNIIGGANTNGNGTVYVMTKDTNTFTLAESAVETVTISHDPAEAMDGTYQVAKVTIPSGEDVTSFSFKIKGVTPNTSGTVYLSTTKEFVYGDSGDLVTNFIAAVVNCTEPENPGITVTIDDLPTRTVTANADYESTLTLKVALSEAYSSDFDVTVAPTMVSGSGTDPLGTFIGVSPSSVNGYTHTTQTVHFAAGETSKELYIYVLGGSDDTAGDGIAFTPSVPDTTAAAYFNGTLNPAVLRIRKSTPEIAYPAENAAYTGLAGGVESVFTITVADDYNDLKKTPYKPYTVQWYKTGSGTPQTFTATPNGDGELTVSVRYNSGSYTTRFRVQNASGVWSEMRTISVQVNEAKQVSAVVEDPDDSLNYDEDVEELTIRFKLTEGYDDSTLYAFLVPLDEASSNLVVCKAFEQGVAIKSGDTESTGVARMTILDGNDDTQPLAYSIMLRTAKTLTSGETIGTYESKDLEIFINNKAPVVTEVNMSGSAPVTASGGTFGGKASLGLNKIFSLVAEDVEVDLTNDVTSVWTFSDPNGNAVTRTVTAPLDDIVLTNVFEVAGTYDCTVKLQDKDMGSKKYGSTFAFHVIVLDTPSVEIVFPESDTYNEMDVINRKGFFYVDLSTASTKPLDVEIVCTQNGADGIFTIATNHVYFRAGQMRQTVNLDELDGTAESYSSRGGFTLTATVVTEEPNEDGIPLKDVYLPATARVFVLNERPTIILPIETGLTNDAAINVNIPIKWKVTDVDADLTNALTVAWTTSEGTYQEFTGDVAEGVFTNVFTSGGAKTVTMTVTDKDDASASVTLYYRVAPSKRVNVYPQGPYYGGGLSTLAKKYAEADGRGQGRVWAQSGSVSVERFGHKYTYGYSDTAAELNAVGYRNGQTDDGTLLTADGAGGDTAISFGGHSFPMGTSFTPDECYTYTDFKGRDSFFYAWVIESKEEEGNSYTGSALVNPPLPAYSGMFSSYSLSLPTEAGGDDARPVFPDRYVEAFFSKELYVADNMGDMNGDRIPDYYATRSWSMDSGESKPICEAMTGQAITGEGGEGDEGGATASDLVDVSAYNGDGDFLPACWSTSSNPLKPENPNWGPGVDFTALYEIRGVGMSPDGHLGLNELGVSDYDLSLAETYALLADYVAAGNTLTGTSEDDYAAATNWATTVRWTPEAINPETGARLNPLKADTDGDGFDDGWEYFFWYYAKIGAVTNGVWGRLEGRRYDLAAPATGTRISSDEIAAAFNPHVLSVAGRDFDNDGLTDLEEYVLGTNPCDWDSDGDGMNDLYEVLSGLDPLSPFDGVGNPDRDFMARCDYAADTFTVFTFANGDIFALPTKTAPTFEVEPIISASTNGYLVTVDESGVTNAYIVAAPPAVGTLSEDLEGLPAVLEGEKAYLASLTAATVASGAEVISVTGEEATYALVSAYYKAKLPGGSSIWFAVKPKTFTNNAGLLQLAADTEGYTTFASGGSSYLGEARTFPVGTTLASVADEAVNMNQVYVSPYMKKSGGLSWVNPETLERESTCLALPLFNYGGDGTTYVPCALTVDKYALAPVAPDAALAEAFGVTLPAGFTRSPIVKVETGRTVTLIHAQVLNQYGFDPRVAWNIDDYGYVDQRWRKADTTDAGSLGATGLATNTVPYTSRDEYLVMQYRQQMREINEGVRSTTASLLHGGEIYLVPASSTPIPGSALRFRTDTTYPNLPVSFVREAYQERSEVSPFDNSTNRTIVAYWEWLEQEHNIHGADTDYDGIPDGWELYVNADPNNHDDGKLRDGWAKDGDELNLLEEYAGVDSCNAYTNRFLESDSSKMIYPEADTITQNHPGRKSGWWNKFFPTNPYDRDTDGDGILDHAEGRAWKGTFYVGNNRYGNDDFTFTFIYGTEENASAYDMDGTTVCFRGGGLNPCTVDTDGDLIPDAWERQFAGVVFKDGAPPSELKFTNSDLQILTMADGSQKAVSTSGCEIRGGMDGTWGPANGANVWGDPCLDFDHDGLANWQEYLVQSLRHLRYDDDKTPLMGIDPSSKQFLKFLPFSAWDGEFFHKQCLDSGFTGLGSWKFSELGYFTRPPHDWDMLAQNTTGIRNCANYANFEGAGYRVMLPPLAEVPLLGLLHMYHNDALWYATTDPRRWDSDEDGMDDYYELFHGLNPLLGSAASPLGTDDYGWPNLRYDVIGSVYGGLPNAWCNYWTGWKDDAPPAFDALHYPWMIGTMECDADGDGLRNDEESIKVNLAQPSNTHTDPTPLWMTDSTSVDHASFTSQYYGFDPYITEAADYDPLLSQPDVCSFPWQDFAIALRAQGIAGETQNWMFSFEEKEGYDTDHDFKRDAVELTGLPTNGTIKVEQASNPQIFSDPDRRQALYLPGLVDGVGSAAASRDGQFRRAVSTEPDLLKTFTVEFWTKPDGDVRNTVLMERVCNYGPSTLSNNTAVLRTNFRVGVDGDGNVYGEFEGTTPNSGSVRATAPTALSAEAWTHIAFTFDGSVASLYLNGEVAPVATTRNAGLIPANGVMGIRQEYYSPTLEYGYVSLPCMTLFGATALNGNALRLDAETRWSDFGAFFKGWVDEVRVWDGARTPVEIHDNYRKRFTLEDVKQLRSNEDQTGIFDQWVQGVRRSSTAGLTLPAELLQHYNFVTLPGGVEPQNVLTEPPQFQENVLDNVRKPNARALDNALLAGWWSQTPVHSTVYWNYAIIPWIGNTVAHLPFLDGSAPDSQYWSTGFAGVMPATSQGFTAYDYPNAANPYPYFFYHRERANRLLQLRAVENLTATNSTASTSNTTGTVVSADSFAAKWSFQLRSDFLGTSDLVPLGGAFAKRGTDFWDGQGAMDAWSETAQAGELADTDGNGIPDWAEALGYTTAEAYLRALAEGLLPDGSLAEAYKALVDVTYDGVPDWWQKLYGLTGSALEDTDKDGLADFAEYLVAEVFKFGEISPILPKSNGTEFDYFRKVGQTYLGALFADHDFMEDHLEREYAEIGADPGVYDAHLDSNENGWSNWAEIRAKYDMGYEINATGAMKTNTVYESYKYYSVYKSRLDYLLSDTTGEIVLLDTDFDVTNWGYWLEGDWFDDFYGSGYIKFLKLTPVYAKTYAYKDHPVPVVTMTVRYNGASDLTGKTLLVTAYSDAELKQADATFTVANGANRNVNTLLLQYPVDGYLREGMNTFVVTVGASSNETASAGTIMGVARNVDVGWSGATFEVELLDESPVAPRLAIEELAGTNGTGNVYVYRYSVDGLVPPSSLNYGPVLVKSVGGRTTLHEGDFLSDADFDLDWTDFQLDVMRNRTVRSNGLPVNEVVYRVYGQAVDLDQESVSSNQLPYVEIVKHFGTARATAVPVAPGEDSTIFYGARPTFRWRMEGDSAETYTAFAIQVLDAAGTTPVWASGTQLAPPRNMKGEYTWTAPLYPGDQTGLGQVFANTNNYTWRVTMYNAKYQSDAWSATRSFRVNAYAYLQDGTADITTIEPNASPRHQIQVTAKYFGPGTVRTASAQTNGILRVEAYTTPDFSGEPAGRTFVRTLAGVTNTAHDVNATIVGLEPGTYYVRAFIDSDGDFKRSAWESWGYACLHGDTSTGAIFAPTAVTVGNGIATPKAVVYVEDCDVDQDCLPDVWEYDNAGTDKTDFLLKKGPMADTHNGYIAVNPSLQTAIANLINGGSSLRLLAAAPGQMSASVAALMLGVPSVEPSLKEGTLAVTSLTLAEGTVRLTLGAEAEDPAAGTVFVSDGLVRATIVVKYADALDGEWKSVETAIEKKIEEGAVSDEITLSLEELGLDASKGFFKVEVR